MGKNMDILKVLTVENNGEILSTFDGFVKRIQKSIEKNHASVRSNIYQFDLIFSQFRDWAYKYRRLWVNVNNIEAMINDILDDIIEVDSDGLFNGFCNDLFPNPEKLKRAIRMNLNDKKEVMGQESFDTMAKTIFLVLFDKYWYHFLLLVENFMSDCDNPMVLNDFNEHCENNFVQMLYYINKNFLYLLLINENVGDIIFNIDKAKGELAHGS